MKVTFLGQGLESKSESAIGNYLVNYLNSTDFYSFTALSAFVSQMTIKGLTKSIEKAKNKYKKLTIIVGIDQEGTSREALEVVLNLNVNSYIFYQSESAIFHPKIYLFEGMKDVKLIIGSSNLTGRGLFINVESSVLIEFTTDDNDGKKLLADLKEYYKSILNFTDANLFKITTNIIENFALKGVLPNELTRKEKYCKKTDILNDDITIDIPKRQTAKIPSSFKQVIASTNTDIDLETHYKNIPNEIKQPFYSLKYELRLLDEKIDITKPRNYFGFKTSKIFAEVHLQMKNIKIVLRAVDYSDFDNVEPIPATHGWGKKIKVYINNQDKLDYFMPLIERSYYSTK